MAYRYRTIKVNGKTKLKHRHIVERRIGRPLRADEHVHHRNENPHDNAEDNLAVLPAAEHLALHAEARRKYSRVKNCAVCGASFTPHPTGRKRKITCSPVCANIQRSRSERATKRAQRERRARAAADMPLFAVE